MPHNDKRTSPIQVAANTDIGRVRSENQDSFGYRFDAGLIVLCDGMGGEAAGQIASKMAVSTVLSFFTEDALQAGDEGLNPIPDGLSEQAILLGSALRNANRAIRHAAAAEPSWRGMGTTIVAGLLRETTLSIAHAGDSRIYLIRGGRIEQLTRDHSLVMEQVRRGTMTLEEAEQSPMRSVITRALGAAEVVEPDLADHEMLAEDVLLFCSDGLTRHVSDDEILTVVSGDSSLQGACHQLIASANAAGGSDNITCVLVRFAPD